MIAIALVLLIASFLFALNSLRGLFNKKEIHCVRNELKKGRVIFQDSSSASDSSKSSESSSS